MSQLSQNFIRVFCTTTCAAGALWLVTPASAQFLNGLEQPRPPINMPMAPFNPSPPPSRPEGRDEDHPLPEQTGPEVRAPFQPIAPYHEYQYNNEYHGGFSPGYRMYPYAYGNVYNRLPDNRVNAPLPSGSPEQDAGSGYLTPSPLGNEEDAFQPPPENNGGYGNDGNEFNSSTIYSPQAPVEALGGPALLGGYYFGDYCNQSYGADTYPTVYSVYQGFPGYLYSATPGVVIVSQPSPLIYQGGPQPFYPPNETVTYNQTNYYVNNSARAADIKAGGTQARQALKTAFPADSFQAAFADIERAWNDGKVRLIKDHLRSNHTKISVFLNGHYKYSLNSSDFAQITRDAFSQLNTDRFKFDLLQRAKNGDVTAYGKHIYTVTGSASGAVGEIVPFDTTLSTSSGSGGAEKTVYVSYTLRHGDNGWYITSIDSSAHPLVHAVGQ